MKNGIDTTPNDSNLSSQKAKSRRLDLEDRFKNAAIRQNDFEEDQQNKMEMS